MSEIRFKDLSDSEWDTMRNKASNTQFSPFAKFMFASVGYRFKTRTGYDLDKWEAFAVCNNFDDIVSGNSTIYAIKKTWL